MQTIPTPEIVMTWQFWVSAIACYIVCEVVKRVPFVSTRDWIVNIVNLIIGIILVCLLLGFTPENVVFGILASAVADIAYQIWKNSMNAIAGNNVKKEIEEKSNED